MKDIYCLAEDTKTNKGRVIISFVLANISRFLKKIKAIGFVSTVVVTSTFANKRFYVNKIRSKTSSSYNKRCRQSEDTLQTWSNLRKYWTTLLTERYSSWTKNNTGETSKTSSSKMRCTVSLCVPLDKHKSENDERHCCRSSIQTPHR